MKFTDKFVLVPIERYERLMDKKADNIGKKDEQNILINKKEQKGGGKLISNSENINIIDQDQNQLQDNTQEQVHEREERKEGEGEHSSIIKTKSESNNEKVPPPPPGIPNKIKSIDFRWLTFPKQK
jgi:hypothetical protein